MFTTARLSLIKFFLKFFDKHPGAGLLLYGAISIFMISVLFHLYGDYARYSEAPPPMSFEAAASGANIEGEAWVSIVGLQWNCSDELQEGTHKNIPLTNKNGKSLIVYNPPADFKSCEDEQLNRIHGVLHRMNPSRYENLKSQGFKPLENFDPEHSWTLCGYCTANDTAIGLSMCSALFLITSSASLLYSRRYFKPGKKQPQNKVKKGWVP